MKIGTENKKQLILLCVLGGAAVIYLVSTLVGMSSDTAPAAPAAAPVVASQPVAKSASGTTAAKLSNASLDPTLHMEGMLLAEAVVYRGNGRNIFSADSAPVMDIPKPVASARPQQNLLPPATQPMGPPPLPPIGLKFFGTASKAGVRQAFLLKGDDVFLAGVGDIVSRRYKVLNVAASYVEVTDLQTGNTQRLPLMVQ